jgi:hypothetical protein
MLHAAVEHLPAWDESRTDDAQAALDRLLAEAPATAPQDAQLLTTPDGPLHAVIVERLPDWDPPRSHHGKPVSARHSSMSR